jgi:hypothetical protein
MFHGFFILIIYFLVFLQVTPHPPKSDPSEGTNVNWTALSTLANQRPVWSHVTVDVASRLAPKNSAILRILIRTLIGSMQFPAIVLHSNERAPKGKGSAAQEKPPKLWGLTLGMTLDLLSYMNSLPSPGTSTMTLMLPRRASPSMASVFPRFSYPDVNFWIW